VKGSALQAGMRDANASAFAFRVAALLGPAHAITRDLVPANSCTAWHVQHAHARNSRNTGSILREYLPHLIQVLKQG
jgi:hypothetical protein